MRLHFPFNNIGLIMMIRQRQLHQPTLLASQHHWKRKQIPPSTVSLLPIYRMAATVTLFAGFLLFRPKTTRSMNLNRWDKRVVHVWLQLCFRQEPRLHVFSGVKNWKRVEINCWLMFSSTTSMFFTPIILSVYLSNLLSIRLFEIIFITYSIFLSFTSFIIFLRMKL